MRRCLLLLAVLPCALHCIAQPKGPQARLDSLLALLPKMQEDTMGVKLMSTIATAYIFASPDDGLQWAQKELALAQRLGWPRGEATAWLDLGNLYDSKSAYSPALEAYYNSLRIWEALADTSGIGRLSNCVGNIYQSLDDYPKAHEWYSKSLKNAEARGDKNAIMTTLGNFGLLSVSQKKYTEALGYEMKALHMAEALNDKRGIIRNTGNISNIYGYLKQHNAELAFTFKALRLATEIGAKRSIAINLGNAGEAYYTIATDSTALLPDSLVPATRAAAINKAVEYLKKGLAASLEIRFYEAAADFAQYLSDALTIQGDYKGALAAYKLAAEAKDSLYNTASKERISTLETARAIALKDKDIQIATLRKRSERILFAAGILVLLLSLVFILRSYRRRQASRIQQVRHNISRDLHDDIGAAITSIGILANISRSDMVDSGKRKEFLETIASQSRHVSEALADIVWSVNPEADELDVMLARFQRYAAEIFEAKGIHYKFSLPPEGMNEVKLNMEQRQHLLLIFKEAVNNLAKYSEATEARITVSLQPHQLIMAIADNGVGFDAASPRRGNGLGNMQKRAAALGAAFELQSFVSEGTSIKLVIPVS